MQGHADSRDVRGLLATMEARRESLGANRQHELEWRRLQYEVVRGLIRSQRVSIALHRGIVARMRASLATGQQRLEALEISILLERFHRLVREIETTLAMITCDVAAPMSAEHGCKRGSMLQGSQLDQVRGRRRVGWRRDGNGC